MMFRKFYGLLLLGIVSITGFFSIASADLSTELTLGLEAYYSFDDTRLNGYVFTQEEDYDLNLVNYTSGGSFIEGIIDNGIYLGSGEGISHAANFPMNGSASYAFWFKDIQGFAFIMGSYTSSNGANRPLIRMNESYVSFDGMDYDPVLYYTGSSDWQHIVINMSNYCKSIILNGKNLQSVCHSSGQPGYGRFSYLTYEKIYLGTSFQAGNPSLFADTTPQGSFDELRVYNRGLSVDEALELYEQGRPSDYGVCGLTGDVELFDASDTCLAGILTGLVYSGNAATPSWTFDGYNDYIESYDDLSSELGTGDSTIVSLHFKLGADGVNSNDSQPLFTLPYLKGYVRSVPSGRNTVRFGYNYNGQEWNSFEFLPFGDTDRHHMVGVYGLSGTVPYTQIWIDGVLIDTKLHTSGPNSIFPGPEMKTDGSVVLGNVSTSYFSGSIRDFSVFTFTSTDHFTSTQINYLKEHDYNTFMEETALQGIRPILFRDSKDQYGGEVKDQWVEGYDGLISGPLYDDGIDFGHYERTCEGAITSAQCAVNLTDLMQPGACGTMQSRTFYEDINNYSHQYTFCEGGNEFMTGLQYLEGNYWDWFCNPSNGGYGEQAYCSAYEYNTTTPLCGNAHSNTYSTGSFEAIGSGAMLCANGDVNGLFFREDFGRLWSCNVESSMHPGVECVSYLSGGLGFITPTYTGENPFTYYSYTLTGTDLVSHEARYVIALMKDYVPFFDEFRTIFTKYFALLPQDDNVSIQLPYITWYGAYTIDSVIFPLVSSINIIEDIECDDLNVWCVYTTKFGSKHRILMNATRLFLEDFLPILFALVYTLSIFMLFSLVVFLPVYLLIPVVSRASDVVVSSFGSTVKIIGTKDTVFAWLIFAVPFFTFVFALIFGYLNLFAPVFNSVKLALLYFLSFVLQNIFFIPVGKMLTTIITINVSLLTIFVLYLVYRLAVFFKIEIKIPGIS